MQIATEYSPQTERWQHFPINKFIGLMSDKGNRYILGITPEDPNEPDCCYFNIRIEKIIKNKSLDAIAFYARVYKCFKVRNDFQKPTPEFYFDLIDRATFEFALLFHQKTQDTNLRHHKIARPLFSERKDAIEKTIEIWDRTARNRILLTPPDWQTTFRDLPEIPDSKRWVKGSYNTLEQDIASMLLHRDPITKQEEDIFTALTSFYEELDKKLKVLDYQSFSETDFENFRNYIFYAFNYTPLLSYEFSIYSTYRLVVNEQVHQKNASITDITYLKYPSLDIVKRINKYNRANTPGTNLFYSSGSIDTAIKEIRPPLDKLITVSIWKPKEENKIFLAYPISHSDAAMPVNEIMQTATKAFEEFETKTSPLYMNFLRRYLNVLGHEFSKKVDYNKKNYHYEYLISALFSERILSEHQEMNNESHFKFDCLIYPSVGNDYMTENVAIVPATLDNDFTLTEVWEFEIDEAFYDTKNFNPDAEEITLATIKKFRKAKEICDDGQIKW